MFLGFSEVFAILAIICILVGLSVLLAPETIRAFRAGFRRGQRPRSWVRDKRRAVSRAIRGAALIIFAIVLLIIILR